MFNFIKKALGSIYQQVTQKIWSLFNQTHIDEGTLRDLEKILISADTGVYTTRTIISNLQKQLAAGTISQGKDLQAALAQQLKALLTIQPYDPDAHIYLLVGVNGSGKTTFAGKLGYWLKKQHKKVLYAAGDTFRAAATEQLSTWGQRLAIPVVTGKENQDPASVIFTACKQFLADGYNCLVIDTAGRLQSKTNLMKELEKIKRIITTQVGTKKISTLLTIDTMLGQNSFDQARIFNESTHVDGIVLTKMDGTGKGGIVFSIVQELKIPIAFISYGEQPDQISIFNADNYISQLLSEE
jgi:fused signal recognition particle receptor